MVELNNPNVFVPVAHVSMHHSIAKGNNVHFGSLCQDGDCKVNFVNAVHAVVIEGLDPFVTGRSSSPFGLQIKVARAIVWVAKDDALPACPWE